MKTSKRCFKCLRTKKLSFFYVHPQMADGHLNKCKTCTKKDVAARYADPIANRRIREYEKMRFRDPHRKSLVKEYAKKRVKAHPGKNRARMIVRKAIRTGKLKRMPCVSCGSKKSEAHHPDYRKPLKIIWLCFVHHREEHGQKPVK